MANKNRLTYLRRIDIYNFDTFVQNLLDILRGDSSNYCFNLYDALEVDKYRKLHHFQYHDVILTGGKMPIFHYFALNPLTLKLNDF